MKRFFKIAGLVLTAAVVLLFVLGGAVVGLSSHKRSATHEVTVSALTVPSDAASIARGDHLVHGVLGCVECHGEDLGGGMAIDEMPVGRVVAPNVTRGGVAAGYTIEDWVRAMRRGVGKSGRALLLMPSEDYARLSSADLGAVIAYVQSRPPVTRDPGETSLGPVGHLLVVLGELPLGPTDAAPMEVTPAETAEYGEYLARSSGCYSCHGEDLSGRDVVPGKPPSANLTPTHLASWSEADFSEAVRAGRSRDGRALDPLMPSQTYASMTDLEVRALFLHIRAVAAR